MHPFFVNNSWQEAKELKAGDKLFAYDGKKIALDSIYSFRTDTATKVYNLEVAGNQDFYVSSTKVLVHNQCEAKFEKMGKSIGKMSGNQQVANKQVKDLLKKNKINDKNIQRKIHNYIHG